MADYIAKIGEIEYLTLQEAVDVVQAGETITLLRDVENGAGVVVQGGKNFTLDFAGYSYSANEPLVGSTGTETNGFQLLQGSTIVFKNGTLRTENAKILIQNYSNLTLDGMTVDGASVTQYVLSNNCGTINLTNGTSLNAAEGQVAFDVYFGMSAGYAEEGVRVTISSSDVVINGRIEYGKASGADADAFLNGAKLIVPSGYELPAPSGYRWATVEGEQVLVDDTVVARIGTNVYQTLQDAVDAVQAGETITLLRDVENGTGVVVQGGKNFTLDFAGYSYSANEPLVGSAGTETNGFQLLQGSTIVFKNGTLRTENAKILIQNYSNLTLDGMTVDGASVTQYVLSNNCGTINLTNGTSLNAAEGQVAFDVYFGMYPSYAEEGVRVTIGSSDVVINGRIEYGKAPDADADAFLNGAKLIVPSGYELPAPSGYRWATVEGEQVLVNAAAVARIGTNVYQTLQNAVAAAGQNDTITLLTNVENTSGLVVEDGSAFILDGNSYRCTSSAVQNSGSITVSASIFQVDGLLDLSASTASFTVTGASTIVANQVSGTITLAADSVLGGDSSIGSGTVRFEGDFTASVDCNVLQSAVVVEGNFNITGVDFSADSVRILNTMNGVAADFSNLSVNGNRVIVNSGSSVIENGTEELYELKFDGSGIVAEKMDGIQISNLSAVQEPGENVYAFTISADVTSPLATTATYRWGATLEELNSKAFTESISIPFTVADTDQKFYYEIQVSDGIRSVTSGPVEQIVEDRTKPVISVAPTAAQIAGTYNFSFQVNGTDNFAVTERLYRWAKTEEELANAPIYDINTVLALSNADVAQTYFYQGILKDAAGNTAISDVSSFKVEATAAPLEGMVVIAPEIIGTPAEGNAISTEVASGVVSKETGTTDLYQVVNAVASTAEFAVTGLEKGEKVRITLLDENGKKLKSASVSAGKNGKAVIKDFLADPGNLVVKVEALTKKGDIDYNLEVSQDYFKPATGNDSMASAAEILAGEQNTEDHAGWVGFGDEVDTYKFTAGEDAAAFHLALSDLSAKVKVTLKNEHGKKIKSMVLTASNYTKKSFSNILVDAGSTVYVYLESTSGKANRSADYVLSAEKEVFANTMEDSLLNPTAAAVGQTLSGWVGYSDASDFFRFEVAGGTNVGFNLTGLENEYKAGKQVKLALYNLETGKKVGLKSVKNSDVLNFQTNLKNGLSAGSYCAVVSIANEKKYRSDYSLGIVANA